MTIADLDEMDARVDIGEMDIVLMEPGLKARLEVDAFRDQEFNGAVTEIANSAKGSGQGSSSQEATRFEVKIRITDKEAFRPGMSVTAEIETRYRTNAITVPIASVTARVVPPKKTNDTATANSEASTNETADAEATTEDTNAAAPTEVASDDAADEPEDESKSKEAKKPVEIVWVVDGDHVNAVPVKLGISDEDYWEVTEGLEEGQEIVTGSYLAISRDLEDGKKIFVTKRGKAGEGEKEAAK
jgi:HlyD family secretion protein